MRLLVRLLFLHAPGGYGKTALIEWFLARYALPKGSPETLTVVVAINAPRLFVAVTVAVYVPSAAYV